MYCAQLAANVEGNSDVTGRRLVGLTLVCVVVLGLLVTQASATTIKYSEQAIASGILGANSFTNALVTFSWTGDTTNVSYSYSDQVYSNTSAPLSAVVTISGLGSASFLYGMYVFSDQDYKTGGFGNWAGPYLYMLYTADATFGSAITSRLPPIRPE